MYHWRLTRLVIAPAKPATQEATSAALQSTQAVATRGFGVAQVWRETLTTLCAHAAPILFLGVIGFAGAAILCTALSSALELQFYIYASGPFAARIGLLAMDANPLGIFDGPALNVHALLLVQAAVGLFVMSFARGAITHTVLQCHHDKLTRFHVACRAALAQFPVLLAGSLVYGGLMALGAIGINLLLHELNLNLSTVGERANSFEGLPGVIALRTINSLMPDPDRHSPSLSPIGAPSRSNKRQSTHLGFG